MATLTAATKQWSTRPADERFSSLQDLHNHCQYQRDMQSEAVRRYEDLRIATENDQPVIVGPSGAPAEFTNWSFGQLCNKIGAPAQYLRTLPAPLAAQNLEHGLRQMHQEENADRSANLLIQRNGTMTVRAFTSERYDRIWNADITSRLLRLSEQFPEWQPAPAAFDGSRGLYASDHDMFAFLVDNNRRIFESDPNGGLSRGFFVSNSEVGAAAFVLTTFHYEYVCGNHRVWGAKQIAELRIRHIGEANDRAFRELACELRRYADTSVSEDEARIMECRQFTLGANREEVIDKIFGLRIPALGKRLVDEAYTLAEQRENWYGNPRSAWGMGGALTEIARDRPFADERVALERAAGKVLALAF